MGWAINARRGGAGDWVGATGGACFIERWRTPAEGSLLGVGRHMNGGAAPRQSRETMRLMEGPDGLVMVVMLAAGQVTRFPLESVGEDGFLARRAPVDVAQGDGWPATIQYARRDRGMVVTLAGAPGERRLDIPFQRVPPGTQPSCAGRVSP